MRLAATGRHQEEPNKQLVDVKDERKRKVLDDLRLEFSDRISLLLKHDWDRAKYEAKPFFLHFCKPIHQIYEEYKIHKQE
ncbi:hypothetical protein MTYM_02129 [Methylococcales bacterium]|nr:hypothetical protein MTYM_02129 [Methylococcales bacterium]